MKFKLATSLVTVLSLLTGCAHMAGDKTDAVMQVSPELQPLAEPPAMAELPSQPFTPEILFTLLVAEMGVKRDRYDIAITHYLHALSNVDDVGVAKRATTLSMQAGAITQALVAGQKWIALEPENLEAQSYVAGLLLVTGKSDLAAPHLQQVMSTPGARADMFQWLQPMVQRNTQILPEDIEKFAARYPKSADAQVLYAQALFNHQRVDEAVNLLDAVLDTQSYFARAVALKIQILSQNKAYDEAIDLLIRAVKVHPEHVGMRIGLLKVYLDAERTDEMYKQYEVLEQMLAGDPANLAQVGFLGLQAKHYAESERFLLQAIQYGMPVEHLAYYLGHISDVKGQTKSAVRWYQLVSSQSNQKFFAEIRGALLLNDLEGADAALRQLGSVQANNAKEEKQLVLLRGELLQGAERWQEAYEVYSSALDDLNNDIQLLYARSLAADRLRRIDLAERDLSEILVQDPVNVLALNALGYSLSNHSKRYEEALSYIERALQLAPDDAAILDSMGWVKFRLGSYDEALSYLSEALGITWDGEIAAHLSEVLWTMGNTQRAQELIEEGLEMAPDNHHLLDVFRRLFK